MTAHQPIEPADPIEAFRSWESDEVKAIRRRLLKARNIASARAASSPSQAARRVFWEANEIAAQWLFAPVEAGRLAAIANALVHLFVAAATLERAEIAEDSEHDS